jgi:hypothetical protein
MTGLRFTSYHQQTNSMVTLYVSDCPSCGVVFGITAEYEDRRREDGAKFYCPNGHSMSWTKSRADLEKERADVAERRLKWAEAREARQRQEREAAERSARAYKGHVTRLRNRITAGVCPVPGCRRNFANVKAHIEGQHPEWAHEHPEVLS